MPDYLLLRRLCPLGLVFVTFLHSLYAGVAAASAIFGQRSADLPSSNDLLTAPSASAAPDIFWPTESPAPLTIFPGPGLTRSNSSTLTASLPKCDGRLYGRNLNLASCLQVHQVMSSYTVEVKFGERGTGHYDANLPFRYLSHDGLCAVDLSHASGIASDTITPKELKDAVNNIILVCVLGSPNTGGLVTGLGSHKGLAVRVIPYRPSVTCGPPDTGPPWTTCRDILDNMPTSGNPQVFGPKNDPSTTVALPWSYTTGSRRCGIYVDGTGPGGVSDRSDWYKIWAAANAVDFMCCQLKKRGVATGLG